MFSILSPQPRDFQSRAFSTFPSRDTAADSWKQEKQMNLLMNMRKKTEQVLLQDAWFLGPKQAVLKASSRCLSLPSSKMNHLDLQFSQYSSRAWPRGLQIAVEENAPAAPAASSSKHQLFIPFLTETGNITE